MSYVDFLNLVKNGFELFIDNIGSVANTLLSNYFFITILGLSIFISLFIFFVNFVLAHINLSFNKKNDVDLILNKMHK